MNQDKYGRNGDTQLVHLRPDEVKGLGLLAQATTGSGLTTNPYTGYPEAFKLPPWVLPAAAIAATVFTAGAAAPVAGAALGGTAVAGAAPVAAGALAPVVAGTATGAAGTALAGTAAAPVVAGAAAPVVAGTGAGATGGLLAADGTTTAGLLASQEAGLGASSLGWGGAQTGAQGGLNGLLGSEAGASVGGVAGKVGGAYSQYGKPAGQVLNAAALGQQMANAQNPPRPPMQAPPQRQVANTDLSGLLNQSQQMRSYQQQEADRRKKMMAMYSSGIGRG